MFTLLHLLVHPFSQQFRIILHERATIYFVFLLLVEFWVVSSFWHFVGNAAINILICFWWT